MYILQSTQLSRHLASCLLTFNTGLNLEARGLVSAGRAAAQAGGAWARTWRVMEGQWQGAVGTYGAASHQTEASLASAPYPFKPPPPTAQPIPRTATYPTAHPTTRRPLRSSRS